MFLCLGLQFGFRIPIWFNISGLTIKGSYFIANKETQFHQMPSPVMNSCNQLARAATYLLHAQAMQPTAVRCVDYNSPTNKCCAKSSGKRGRRHNRGRAMKWSTLEYAGPEVPFGNNCSCELVPSSQSLPWENKEMDPWKWAFLFFSSFPLLSKTNYNEKLPQEKISTEGERYND